MTEETARGPSGGEAPGPDQGKQEQEDGAHPRGKWANDWEFLLSMTGVVVGIGSLWTLSSDFYNGGVAFLIPYSVCLLLFGFPLFLLETAVGQYTSEGAVTAWRKICPMFTGVGIASQVIALYYNTYSIVLLVWTLVYLAFSFFGRLPWSSCDNPWNSEECHGRSDDISDMLSPNDSWSFLHNFTWSEEYYGGDLTYQSHSPEEEFWMHRVLRWTPDKMGTVNWDLALCLAIVWILCYFCVWKGHRVIGKIVYFTTTVPYLLLLVLFLRAVTLPGAADGLSFYFFTFQISPMMWITAAYSVMSTLGLCAGVLTTLGSYNRYNSNCYRSCLILCGVSVATVLFAGIVVFSLIGFLAHTSGVPISYLVNSGPDLIFVVLPSVLTKLPASNFWCVLFFLLVFLLGIDTQFMFTETLATAITDMFPHLLRRPGAREVLVLVLTVVCFLLGLMFVTEGGIVIFHMIDKCCASGFIFIACAESIVIGWVYGADRFYDNIEDMIGHRLNPLFKYCWMFAVPFFCEMLLLELLSSEFLVYVYGHVIQHWVSILGAVFLIVPLMCIPVFIVVSLCKDAKNMAVPSRHLRQAQPHKPVLTLCTRIIFKSQAPPTRAVDEPHEKMMMMEAASGV